MKAKKSKIEDAKNATKAGVEEGILPGGGVALIRAAKVLDGVKTENEDEKTASNIVPHKAVFAPLPHNSGERRRRRFYSASIRSYTRPLRSDTTLTNSNTWNVMKAGIVDPLQK